MFPIPVNPSIQAAAIGFGRGSPIFECVLSFHGSRSGLNCEKIFGRDDMTFTASSTRILPANPFGYEDNSNDVWLRKLGISNGGSPRPLPEVSFSGSLLTSTYFCGYTLICEISLHSFGFPLLKRMSLNLEVLSHEVSTFREVIFKSDSGRNAIDFQLDFLYFRGDCTDPKGSGAQTKKSSGRVES